uniref:G-protein coupled receptors family 3 profile domain-containing protein n=1 Tax=Strigamia maritima TaxID=126957 RepID=T1IUR5_STRMM
MYDLLYNPPQKLMLLCGCSIVCTTVGEAAKMWNLVVVSYGASSPALSNRARFETFFRTHPSATVHNPTRIRIFQRFGWKRVAILQQAEEVFISTVEDLESRCKEEGIEIITRQSFLTDPTDAVRNLRRQDARIIIGLFYVAEARRVLCEIYKSKMFGKQYVWFFIGWYEDNWYRVPDKQINCTIDQMKEAAEGHLTTEALMLNQDSKRTISGMTSQEFIQRLDEELIKDGYNDSKPEGYQEAPLAYDAIWAVALALDKTMKQLEKSNMKLEDFNYTNKFIADQIYSAMNSTSFLGVSGSVAFSAKGDRIAWTLIEQMRDGQYHQLGFYDTRTENLSWSNEVVWIGGRPPRDQTIVMPQLRNVSLPLFIGMGVVSILGIIIAIGLLIFTIVFGSRRFIELSHPVCNMITLIGIIMCLLSVIFLGIDGRFVTPTQYPIVCQARAWILTVGFTLAYGSMFTKIWRVHRITTKTKHDPKKKISRVDNRKLFGMLGVMIAMDLIILLVWQILDPLERRIERFLLEENINEDEDIRLEPQLEHCESDNNIIWFGILYGYKGLLLIFGIFLAYETRSIKVKQINDSRYVGMSIYNVVVLCMITAPVTLVISSQQDASFAFVALAIIFCCFLSMALVYGPKVTELIHHPRDRAESRHLTDSLPSKEEEEKHQKLIAENEELKRLIAEQEDKIRMLNHRLQEKRAQQVKTGVAQDGGEKGNNGCSAPPDSSAPTIESLTFDSLPAIQKEVVVVDLNSDSAITVGMTRSTRASPSDFELSESYL